MVAVSVYSLPSSYVTTKAFLRGLTVTADLLHHDSVVALKGDIHIHVGLHGPDLVGSQEALPPTALPAILQNVHPAPGGCSLQTAGQHMDGFAVLWISLCMHVLHQHSILQYHLDLPAGVAAELKRSNGTAKLSVTYGRISSSSSSSINSSSINWSRINSSSNSSITSSSINSSSIN